MKRIGIIGKFTALALAAVFSLCACNSEQTAASSSNATSDISGTGTIESNETTVSVDTSGTVTQADSNNIISQKQAVEITKDMYTRTSEIYYCFLLYPSFSLGMNSEQPLPKDSNYLLITDERFQSMADIRTYTETAYTPAYIDKYFTQYFDEQSPFWEYNGRLYGDYTLGGIGCNIDYDWDNMRIISQDKNSLTVELTNKNDISENPSDTRISTYTYVMKKTENLWRLDDEFC